MTREPLPPEAYARVFEGLPEGRQVYDELVAIFGRNPYVRGGPEAARETDFRAGQLSVVSYILKKVNQANGVEDHENETAPPAA